MSKIKLLTAAKKARKNSHSPYSREAVGAAIKLKNGKIYSGCNIENASYGGTVCAERVAIWKALSENPKAEVIEVLVVTDHQPAWPPCGLCLQVMTEFAQPKALIHIADVRNVQRSSRLKDLLPSSFTKKALKIRG